MLFAFFNLVCNLNLQGDGLWIYEHFTGRTTKVHPFFLTGDSDPYFGTQEVWNHDFAKDS